MNTSRPIQIAVIAALACSLNHAHAQKLIWKQSVPVAGGLTRATVVYESEGVSNPGTKGLQASGSSKLLKIERAEDGSPTRITSDGAVWTVRPSTENWAAEDPKAFTTVFSDIDGTVIRESTIAAVKVGGTPMVVARSVYLGEKTRGEYGRIIEKGEIERTEYTIPSPGMGVVTTGKEIGGVFHSTSKNTRIRYRDEKDHKIIRDIAESRDEPTEKWKADSDVLTESKKIGYQLEKIREVKWPDGESLTETWEYYTNGELTHPDGSRAKGTKLKCHTDPDGTKTTRYYGEDSSITETSRPGEPVERVTNSFRKLEKDADGHDVRERTEITERDGKEVYRTVKKFEFTRVTTVTTRADGSSETLIEDFYPGGKMFGGKPRRTIYPDGKVTTWERTQLEDGRFKLVTETGRGDGERVVEGRRETTVHSARGQLLESKSEEIKRD
jgi:hypothetical protein